MVDDALSVFPSPAEGVLQPNSDTLITFTFRPKFVPELRGFKAQEKLIPAQNYLARLQIQMLESMHGSAAKDEPLDLVFKGRTCVVQAKLDKQELVFDTLQVMEQKTLVFSLLNESLNLALPFLIEPIAHFKFEPAKGCLSPKASQSIQVTFSPNQIGSIDKTIKLKLFGRDVTAPVEQLNLRLKGTCFMVPNSQAHKPASPISNGMSAAEDSDDGHATVPSTVQTNFGSDDNTNSIGVSPRSATRFDKITAQAPINLDRMKHDEHRRMYGDMIRSSRKDRLLKQRHDIFLGQRENENALDNKRSTHEVIGEWRKTDVDNGLIPPELRLPKAKPNFKIVDALSNLHNLAYYRRKVVSLAIENDLESVEPSYCHSDERRLLMLFQHLLESGHSLAKNAPLITVDGNGLLQKMEPVSAKRGDMASQLNYPLSAGELCNVFTPHSKLDFGVITNHSANTTTLCFLNATTSKTPITVTLSATTASANSDGKRDNLRLEHHDHMSVEPASLQIPPLSVGIFHLTMESHRSNTELNDSHGYVEAHLAYQINDKFKYSLPIVATMNPIQVELRGDGLVQGEMKLHAAVTKNHATAAPQVEKTMQLVNTGSSRARFTWAAKNPIAEDDGSLEVTPSSGFIQAKSSVQLRIIYRPGMKTRIDQNFVVTIYDPYFDNLNKSLKKAPPRQKPAISFADDHHDSSVLSVIPVKINGEVTPSKYTIMGLPDKIKAIPQVDFGILPVSTPQFAAYAKTRPPKLHRFYSSKVMKIRNPGSAFAYFTVANSNASSEVAAHPTSGVIDPDGGVLELMIWVIPSRPSAQPVEDYVVVNIAGSGKQIRIPVLYESKTPHVECIRPSTMKFSCAVGSSDRQELFLKNSGQVAAKVLFDMRGHPELSIMMEKVFTVANRSPDNSRRRVSVASKQQATSGLDAKNNEMMYRLARIGEDDDMIEWCFRNYVSSNQEPFAIRMLNKFEQKSRHLYSLELLPNQQVLMGIHYKPTEKIDVTKMLPMRVFGVSNETSSDPLNMTFPVHLNGFVSPLKISRTNVVFKNKIVYVRDPATGHGPMRASIASREAIELRNVGDEAITWTLDPDVFGEATDMFASRNNLFLKHSVGNISTSTASSDVFKFDVWNGVLQPGEVTTITASFYPPVTGHYATSVSIFVNYDSYERSAFLLEFNGTGVEPALIFDPPEIFLPVSQQGEESVVVFSLINYGYDRNEISYSFSDDLNILLGARRKKEKQSALQQLQQDGQTIAQLESEEVAIEDENPLHGSVKLLFPEGKQLKSDGEPLPVVLRFLSPVSHPLSFTSHVRFFVYDSGVHGIAETKPQKSFYLAVSGTSDSSMLTLWPHMEQQVVEEPIVHAPVAEAEVAPSTGRRQRANTFSHKAMIYDRLKAHGVNADNILKR